MTRNEKLKALADDARAGAATGPSNFRILWVLADLAEALMDDTPDPNVRSCATCRQHIGRWNPVCSDCGRFAADNSGTIVLTKWEPKA